MKRVLMTGDTVGGVWTFTLELAEALGRHGVEVALAAMGGVPTESQRAEAARIPNLRLFESSFKLEWMDDPWDDVQQAGAWLLDLARSFAPDLVHLNSFGHGTLPWTAPVVLTAHSCVLSWWNASKRTSLPQTWSRYREEVTRSLHAADMVIAPTQAMLDTLHDNYGRLPRTRVVLNGREPSRFHWGAKEDFILAAGRLWDEGKNIRALAGIAPVLPWPVYVAGEAGQNHISNCRPLGRLSASALASWYARAGIYALPAYYEPFGLSVLEAALSGCALVLGDIPSLREIWEDAALFVSPNDTHALRHTLQRVINDRPLRSSLSRRAHFRALEYGPERMADQYFAIYQEAAHGAKALCA